MWWVISSMAVPFSAGSDRVQVALLRELERDVDQHVLLAADVAGLAGALEDLVRRYAVALGGVLGVQQERRVDTCPALDDGGAVGLGPARQVGRTTSSAASSTPPTSTPVSTPRWSKVAARTSVGELPAPAPSAHNEPSICRAPDSKASTELATPSDRFWCPWKPTWASRPTSATSAAIRALASVSTSAPAESTA